MDKNTHMSTGSHTHTANTHSHIASTYAHTANTIHTHVARAWQAGTFESCVRELEAAAPGLNLPETTAESGETWLVRGFYAIPFGAGP